MVDEQSGGAAGAHRLEHRRELRTIGEDAAPGARRQVVGRRAKGRAHLGESPIKVLLRHLEGSDLNLLRRCQAGAIDLPRVTKGGVVRGVDVVCHAGKWEGGQRCKPMEADGSVGSRWKPMEADGSMLAPDARRRTTRRSSPVPRSPRPRSSSCLQRGSGARRSGRGSRLRASLWYES